MKKLGIFIVAALVIIGTIAYSQPFKDRGLKDIVENLKLTEQQKKDFEKVRVDMEKKQIEQRAKFQTAHVELEQLLKDDNPDKTAIEKKLKDMADLGVQLHMIKINSWFDVNKLLTPEQQKTWKKALEVEPGMGRGMMDHQMMKDHKMGKGHRNMPEPPSQPAPQPPDAPSPK